MVHALCRLIWVCDVVSGTAIKAQCFDAYNGITDANSSTCLTNARVTCRSLRIFSSRSFGVAFVDVNINKISWRNCRRWRSLSDSGRVNFCRSTNAGRQRWVSLFPLTIVIYILIYKSGSSDMWMPHWVPVICEGGGGVTQVSVTVANSNRNCVIYPAHTGKYCSRTRTGVKSGCVDLDVQICREENCLNLTQLNSTSINGRRC